MPPVDLVVRTLSTTSLFPVVPYLLLRDSFGVVWALTVGPNGNLITTVSSGAAISFFTLQDSSGVYWKVTLSGSNGNLDTTVTPTPVIFFPDLFFTDSSGRNWLLTVTTLGDLDTI